MPKNVIYEARGRAREYCELAMNLYSGCAHACTYCYGPDVTYQAKASFITNVRPRLTTNDINVSAAAIEGEERPILMCFITDPYQPIEEELKLTRNAIAILHDYDLHFSILTKGGRLAQRDFPLYRPGDSFGVTLTFLDDKWSRHYEPGAALPAERMANLRAAHETGIMTWVSLEPVIDPMETIAVITETHSYVDHYKIGKLNYKKTPKPVSWRDFARLAMIAMHDYNKGFQLKRDLGQYIGYPDGLREGMQIP